MFPSIPLMPCRTYSLETRTVKIWTPFLFSDDRVTKRRPLGLELPPVLWVLEVQVNPSLKNTQVGETV